MRVSINMCSASVADLVLLVGSRAAAVDCSDKLLVIRSVANAILVVCSHTVFDALRRGATTCRDNCGVSV